MRPTEFSSTPSHQPLRWWSSTQLSEIANPIERAWRDWLAMWSPARAGVGAVTCELAWDDRTLAAQSMKQFGSRKEARAWCSTSGEFEEVVAMSLFAPSADPGRSRRNGGPMASSIAAEAAEELLHALRDVLQLDPDIQETPPGPSMFRPWSGAVAVSIALGKAALLRFLMDGKTAAGLVAPAASDACSRQAPRGELITVEEACALRTVSLQVKLAPCELEIGALRSLQVGDIVPLPHALDAPLQVIFEGAAVCHAFLGKRHDAVAIELIRHPLVSQHQNTAATRRLP